MGKRQRKNRLIYRACLVIFLIKSSTIYSQKGTCVIYLQNAFYQEFSKFDDAHKFIVNETSVSFCDSLVGALKPYFLENYKQDTLQKTWEVSSIFTFDYKDGQFAFVSVNEMKDTLIIETKFYSFYKDSSCWREKKEPELENIEISIQYLKPDSFWAFYNSEPSEIPEIDAIKAKYKTPEGILDIDKLGAYLKTKPKELEKYCDF